MCFPFIRITRLLGEISRNRMKRFPCRNTIQKTQIQKSTKPAHPQLCRPLQKKEEIVKFKTILTLALWTAALWLSIGCKTTGPNTNDSTPPTVEFKVKGANGQYATASSATLTAASNEAVDFMCVNSDPEGVSSIALSYSNHADSCTTSGGAIYSGSFTIDGLPAPATQNLSPNQGQVLTSIPLLATVKSLSCSIPPQLKGFPYGAKVTVTCTGKNYSSNSQASTTVKTLDIKLQ